MLPALQKVVSTAVSRVPCDFAAAAVADEFTDRQARLAASTDEELASAVATSAVEAGDSPGIRAFETGSVVSCSDLAEEGTFGAYARLVRERTPIRSVLAVPLQIDGSTVGVMTMYADQPGAFDEAVVARALVLGEHAAIALESAMLQDETENLQAALLRSRLIGRAQGVLMERYKISAELAFARLTRASQVTNRKLSDVAAELVETGTAPVVDELDNAL